MGGSRLPLKGHVEVLAREAQASFEHPENPYLSCASAMRLE
jgi:hypothetical protein